MSNHDLTRWAHTHRYSTGNASAERGTRLVMWITIATMLVEIVAGWWFNSMAVLADGWHMSSHALAIGLSAFAYGAARKYAADPSFAFGTWKIEVLASYTSAIFLLGVAAAMIFGSLERLLAPQEIHYQEAMAVAILGLVVNLVCALILGQAHDHDHHHGHGHDHAHHGHDHGHDDLNLKAAYIHVVTDAATSVLAIAALGGGWFYGWAWLAEIRDVIAQLPADGQTELTDLHVWRVGTGAYACALSLLTHDQALTPLNIRDALAAHEEIVHATVEIHRCDIC